MNIRIPIYQPLLNGNEKKYVNDCLDSSWISSRGKYISLFEEEFSKLIGINHSISVCNGTVAMHLALVTLGIKAGDEVIVPSFTYIASVSTIVMTGATPVFVDSLEDTWQMDPEDVKRKITPSTKAIVAVHIYGHPCEMNILKKIAKENNIYLVEDCAEALGALYHNKNVGTFGDISTFSFFGNKTITTGEGGMVVTNDDTLNERAYHLKMQGLSKDREYWHDTIGYNYRMTNICAAIGLAQLENADKKIQMKRELRSWYEEIFSGVSVKTHREVGDVFHSYWMYSILLDNCKTRDDLRKHLSANGIETKPTFNPVHTMPMFTQKLQKFPVAEHLGSCGINLPSWPGLSRQQIGEIGELIKKYLEENKILAA